MADVRLAEYDPAWPVLFEVEAAAIADALGDDVIEIEHIGSTAVPGLASKPTIDIAVGARTTDVQPPAVERMAALGYEDAGAASRPGERRFRKGLTFPREVLVHVVEWGGAAWRDYLAFRDLLRADAALAREYEKLKRALLAKRGKWYRGEDKQEFIDRALHGGAAQSVVSASPAETEEIAAKLAVTLRPGDVVTVSGELGSGKTTFVRGACRALGVDVPVTSPTFTIGHRYRGRVDVSHLDLFRFRGVSAAEWGDLEPYFEDAIVFVEWPEAGEGVLPPPRIEVRLEHGDGGRRLVTIRGDADSGVRHGD